MKKTGALTLGLVVLASSAFASNTGFKLNYPIRHAPGTSGNNWVSLPSFYFPNGNVSTAGPQNAVDLCKDVNDFAPNPPPKVGVIFRFDSVQDKTVQQLCNITFSFFNLVPGEAYSMVPPTDNQVINIVGSNNDQMNENKVTTPTRYNLRHANATSGNNWVSVPYHALANNAVDLCKDANDVALTGPPPSPATKVGVIFRFDSIQDKTVQQLCNIAFSFYNLVPGEGYSMVPPTDNQTISLSVY